MFVVHSTIFLGIDDLHPNDLELKTLTKQMQLMKNIFDQYFDEVKNIYWKNLRTALISQEAIIRKKIMEEEGSKKKEKAENAFKLLLRLLK